MIELQKFRFRILAFQVVRECGRGQYIPKHKPYLAGRERIQEHSLKSAPRLLAGDSEWLANTLPDRERDLITPSEPMVGFPFGKPEHRSLGWPRPNMGAM